MALDPKLLEILACPEDKGPLLYFEDESSLYNPRLKRRYAVRDDIPIMLIDEAETVDDTEAARLDAKAAADGIQPTFAAYARPVATDSLGFGEALCSMPEQLAAAHEAAGKVPSSSLPDAHDFDHIVTLGMGGSGIAGNVLQAVGTATLPVPVTVLKHYRTPAFVGSRTLAFALSHSGNTEETLEMARGALAAGARLVAISSGGELADARRAVRIAARALRRRDPDAAPGPRCTRRPALRPPVPHGHAPGGARRPPARAGADRPPARPVQAERRPGAQSARASWRARSGAPSRSSTGAAASAASRPCAGSSR